MSEKYNEPRVFSPTPREVDPQAMHAACVPEDYQDVRLSDFEGHTIHVILQRFVRRLPKLVSTGAGLYMHGDFGHGKTRAACVLLRAACAYQVTRMFVTAAEIVSWTYSKRPEPGLVRARSANMLVLDDVGREYSTDYGKTIVENFIRARVASRKSTVITSNLSLNDAVKVYGAGTVSIIKSRLIPVHVQTKDWREAQADKLLEEIS